MVDYLNMLWIVLCFWILIESINGATAKSRINA